MSVLGIDDTLLRVVSYVALAFALGLSGFALARYSTDEDGIIAELQDRFVFGIPWGTAIVIFLVYAIYYIVQGGGQDGGPIVVGFRSWSLWYPQSILFSSFTHSSDAHLMGNLFGTLAFAPIVEYAWRHYPEGDSGGLDSLSDTRFESLQRNPVARIALFVFVVFLVGLVGSVIVPGAVIGFSGVVFAFAGFAIVTFPIATVCAMLGIQVIRIVHRSVTDPWMVAQAQERFVRPSWADVAVQGHLYGLIVGVLLGVLLLHYRGKTPNLRHVFFAALVFAITRSLQAIYWFLGNDRYVLFLAIGTAGVFVLATLIALAVLDQDRMLVPRIDLRVKTAAAGLLLCLVLALALLGIPYNLVSVTGGEEIESGIEIEDYTITYAENVEDRYISALDLPVYQGPSVNMSGVIVVSDQRNVWERTVSKQQLASEGSATVAVGDATWRETVEIRRSTWRLAGGNETYKVAGRHDEEQQLLFVSEAALAEPVINGSQILIRPTEGAYEILVATNQSVIGTATVPTDDESVTINNITFERQDDKLLVSHDRTHLKIATFES